MTSIRTITLSVLAAAVLGACAGMPDNNFMLDQARSDYRDAQASSQTQTYAPAELRLAGDALAKAEAAQARKDDLVTVNQLSYLARQRVALANQAAGRKGYEADVAAASSERDALRLTARTREADAANRSAAAATRDANAANTAAAASQRQSEAAQRQTANAQQQAAASRQLAADANQQAIDSKQQASDAQLAAMASKQQASDAQQAALASQQQSATLQQQAAEAEQRRLALEKQLSELNAKKTERGMVITMGDVLFDTGAAQLKSGGLRNVERLGGFLKQYPKRKALIEGYTDSTGSDSSNQALSERRADAVMTALVGMGVNREQLASHGYGETHPVAGNDNSGGRQMNRRVEIVLSDEAGVVNTR
jgi:outer membrane protein OmpA-like peptidoglycan-associated protein